MSIISFVTEKDQEVEDWVKATKERGKEKSLLKNPFHWKFKTFKLKDEFVVVMEGRPVFFNFSIFGWVSAILIVLVWGFSGWVIPFLIIGALGFFWTGNFLYFGVVIALKKRGYKGRVRRLRHAELIKRVVLK